MAKMKNPKDAKRLFSNVARGTGTTDADSFVKALGIAGADVKRDGGSLTVTFGDADPIRLASVGHTVSNANPVIKKLGAAATAQLG